MNGKAKIGRDVTLLAGEALLRTMNLIYV